jgi:hypothetical protein
MSRRAAARYFSAGIIVFLFAAAGARTQEDAAVVKDFQGRLSRYMALRKKQNLQNKQTSSPEQLAQQKHKAFDKIEAARAAAHQGDIFTPAIAAYFKRQIEATMRGADGKKVRASLRHAEPLPTIDLKVNANYPKNLPLQSTPATLLQNLPLLPKELQYRIVGSTLLLYDVPSDLVLDLIPAAIGAA